MSDFFSSETLFTVWLTLKISVVALLISWALAWLVVKLQSKFVFSLSRVLWVLPGMGYAMLTLIFLRAMGASELYSLKSVMLAWVMAAVPYLALGFKEALTDLDPREREALQSLGASPLQVFFHFDFKRTLSAQVSVLTQQFWLFLTSFSLVMILNGGPPNETLEVSIFTSILQGQVMFSHVIALALWQTLILLSVKILAHYFFPKEKHGGAEWSDSVSKPSAILIFGSAFAILVLCILTNFYFEIFMSLLIAFTVAIFALMFVMSSHHFKAAWISEVGAWFSPMVLALVIWKTVGDVFPGVVNVLLIQTLLFTPWLSRVLVPSLKRARMMELEATQSLGASKLRAWFLVEWPRLRPTIIRGCMMVAALSIAEVASIMLLGRGQFETLSSLTQGSFMRFRMSEGFLGTALMVSISVFMMEVGET